MLSPYRHLPPRKAASLHLGRRRCGKNVPPLVRLSAAPIGRADPQNHRLLLVHAHCTSSSNETQDERRQTRARVARSESAEVISKVERTAVRRSLHRLVRSLWVYWRPWRNDRSAAP